MLRARLGAVMAFAGTTLPAFSQSSAPAIDKADTAWLMVASVLVLLMTPALALFYGGLVRRRNVLSTMMHSYILMGAIGVAWVLIGFSLAFGASGNGLIGNFEFAFGNVSMSTPYGEQTVPAALFMLFQMMFAILTPALISGALAERVKFGGYILFMVLWSVLVYAPVACWVWNADGWLFKLGALDFAGGTVVHLASGVAALAACAALGQRHLGAAKPNSVVFTLTGAGLLWVGWIGFNAGSALGVNDVAVVAFVTTQIAGGAGMLGWLAIEKVKTGKATAVGAASGLVSGLVGITPGAGFVSPMAAIVIGLLAGSFCYSMVSLKHRFGYDDALDVVAVHGAGGLLGAILTGVFASAAINPGIAGALEGGRGALIVTQLIAVAAVFAYSGVLSFALMKLVQIVGMRASVEDEVRGLDSIYHGEEGFDVSPDGEFASGDSTGGDAELVGEASVR
ncbi:MAG: ammonium transporter [Fimbriimonadaceae bacterium]